MQCYKQGLIISQIISTQIFKTKKMNTELVKVDPKEFGLEEVQVATIEQAFMPKIVERDGYAVIYEQLITKELTKELCNEAGDFRRKLVKVRTGIADIHKTQKAFFLSAGRFVDAWKNKETLLTAIQSYVLLLIVKLKM